MFNLRPVKSNTSSISLEYTDWQIEMPKRRDTINYVESTYVFGEDEVALEVPVRVLALADAVCEGAVGLVPVHAHVARRVVDQVVYVVAELTGGRTPSCLHNTIKPSSLTTGLGSFNTIRPVSII